VPTDSLFPTSRFSVSERRAVLAGRAHEMHELERSYEAARDEKLARTATVLGPTGIGKTRLVRDFLVRSRERGQAPRVFRGTAREGGPAYEVFARVLRARFGIVEGMDAEAAKARVRAQLATVLDDRKVGDVAYFLGQLLDLQFQDSPLIRAIEGDVQQLRSMRRAVIKSFLEIDATKGTEPLVLVLDDLQWAHDDSLALLAYLVESLRGPILTLCLARPEMLARRDGWKRHGGDRHVLIELAPLGDIDAAAVVKDLLAPCGEAAGIDDLVDEAVVLSGGNPALLDQIVRIYHDTGVLETTDDFEDERWAIHLDKLAQVKLPLSVQDAVQARIAALAPEERELLERAAAMGGVFWLGGLVAVHRQSGSPPEVWEGGEAEDVVRIRQLLTDLVERDYVLRLPDSTFAGDEEYVFKHNLEREALLSLSSPAAARDTHRALAEWLAFQESVEGSEEYLEMLARHRGKAGTAEAAASAYIKAGDVARSRYANAKAAELYAKGLALLELCEHADADLRLTALHHSGDVLQSLGRNEEAYRAFADLLAGAWRLDLRSRGGAAHSRLGRLYRETGRLDEASRQLTAALALFGQGQDEPGIAGALDDIGRLHWLKGDPPLALEYMLRSLAMRRKLGDRRSIALSLNNLGLVHQDAGNSRAAREAFEEALGIRRNLGDLVGVGLTLNRLGMLARDVRDDPKALALFQEAYEVAKETGDRNRVALLLTNLGETHGRLGDLGKATALLEQARDLADELGDKLVLAQAVRGLGKAYLAKGDAPKARACALHAVELLSETESKVELAVALRSLAEATTAAMPGTLGLREASDYLRRSISILEEVRNEVELARSCRAYADLLRQAPEHASNPAIATEARLLSLRAEEIFARLQASIGSGGSDALFAR
jgi:tetratricopeptide (TPR) repeat protein